MRASRVIAIVVLVAAASPELGAQLRLRPLFSGFTTPIAVVQDPADRNVQFVVQQNGHIRVMRGGAAAGEFLDLSAAIVSGGEQGLLGLAFAPDSTTSGRFFVDFTHRSGDTVVARFRRPNNGLTADAASRIDLRWGGAAGQAF